ncbi:MAG: glycosyltransferase family 2 protein [Flavobacteriales bacterium]|nr:glycosyltransferase family 2 protein [Flavobacteriales bacterium]
MDSSDKKIRVQIIIPVFNEAGNMPRLLQSLEELLASTEYDFEFVFVDDGSTDNTAAVINNLSGQLPIHLVRHEKNSGPGKAFGSGFSFLSKRISAGDIVVTMEGDNTSRMETLLLMLGRIKRENFDCAFASVYAYGGGFGRTSGWRIFLSHVASFLTKVFLGIHGIHTFTSFFRAYKADMILTLQKNYGDEILESRGFECMVELLKKIMIMGFSISEVPMQLDTSNRAGKSKMKIMKTVKGYFRVIRVSGKWKR